MSETTQAERARYRANVERFAFAAAITFPDLLEESSVGPEHFVTEIIGQAFAALPRCTVRTPDGRMSVVEIAMAAGVSAETLKPVLQAQVYSADQARAWWRKLVDLATVDAIGASVRAAIAVGAAAEETDASGTLLAKLERVLREFGADEVDHETVSLLDSAERFVRDRSDELRTGRRRGVQTGLEIVDRWMGGLNAGELTTIVAAGGVGKTTIAMDIARRVARTGLTVLYWSAEMVERQMGQREAHAAIGRSISDMSVTAVDLVGGLEEIENSAHADRIRFAFGSKPTAARLLATARRVQHRSGLGLVILDHLGHLDSERPRASEQEQIAFAVAACKDLAKALDVPFLLITHFNRQGLIRGSERIRDTSDNVLELKRDADNAHACTEARLLKARQTGETHKAMQLHYSLKWQTFVEGDTVSPSQAPQFAAAGGKAPWA